MTILHRSCISACLLLASCSHAIVFAQSEFTFAYLGDTSHTAYSGVEQGLDEANLQGGFLGQEFRLETYSSIDDFPENPEHFLALFIALPADEILRIRELAAQHPVFNLVADDDSLRSSCLGNVLHTIPSHKMKLDAIKQWQQKHAGADISAQAWHPDFVKFAARDLNKRFRKAYNRGMDDYAWSGWAAVKMTADAIARRNITNSVQMLNYLKTDLAFDGQKGINMSFRETGQLRQPILISDNGKLLGEAPVRGVSSDIDSLGIPECLK